MSRASWAAYAVRIGNREAEEARYRDRGDRVARGERLPLSRVPSLAALVDTLDSVPAAVDRLIHLPRVAFLALGLLAVLGLTLKDRWLRAPLALAIDAVIGAPAFAVIALLAPPIPVLRSSSARQGSAIA